MNARRLQDTALRYFLEVVRCGSLAEASARLHVAASALSRQIAGLEEALGVPLFERQPRGMVPTAAGELLAAHARRTGLDAERTVEEIQALQGLRRGRVRIAATEGLAAAFLPPLIAAWRREHPQIRFELQVMAAAQVTERLREGAADLGLTFSRAPAPDIVVAHRQPSTVVAVLRADHPLAAARTLTLARLAGHDLALPPPDTTLRQLIDLAASRQQLLLEPVLESGSLAALLAFVREGGGATLAGVQSVRPLLAEGRLVARPLRDRGLDLRDIELQTLAGRTLPAAARGFLDELRRQLAEGVADLPAD